MVKFRSGGAAKRWFAKRAAQTAPTLAALSLGFMASALALCAADATNRAPLAVWDVTVRASVGGGYRDNVLRTSVAPKGSALFTAAADASFIRLSESGSQLTFFLMGEDTRYLDSVGVEKEQFFMGRAQLGVPVGARGELGSDAQYLYQHQIIDVSETEANLRSILVEGHGVTFLPYWKHKLGDGWTVQLEGGMDRQFYMRELDDFWEGQGKLSLLRSYGRRSELSVSYQSKHRWYDSREQFDPGGVALTNTSLVYWQQEVATQWRHYWDAGRHWRTTTKASFMLNRDNGSGYFDYDRVLFSEQLRWRNHGWEARANARFGWYFYDTQRIEGEGRERSYCLLDLRVERQLGKHWFVYATAEHDWNWSNDPLDTYRVWMAGGGLGAEF